MLDRYEVFCGYANYTEDGRHVLQDGSGGVRLALQRPEKAGPFFSRERRWEAMLLNHMSLLYDQGRYRMWYSAWPDPDDPAIPGDHAPGSSGNPEYICYAESEDGLNWERPELGLCEYGGSRATNILFPAGYFGFHSIFVDATAPPEERYRAVDARGEIRMDGRLISKPELIRLRAEADAAGDAGAELAKRLKMTNFLRGAVSADGIHWECLEEPLVAPGGALDTQNIVAYDEERGQYVAYLRGGVGRRRSVRYSCSKDFRRGWTETRIVFATDSQDPWDVDVYTPAYGRYPTGTHRIMFPSFYHRASDVLDIHLAVSRDGVNWTRPERRALVDRAVGNDAGRGEFGSLYAAPGLLPLGEDGYGLAYLANRRNHNEWDWKRHRVIGPDGEYWWAKWKRDRLVALEADAVGKATLVERPCVGDRLLANFWTEPGGWLLFELTPEIPNRTGWEQPPAIPGYSFSDCAPLQGDSLAQPVTWNGKADLSALKGTDVVIRVKMVRAKLFALAI
jgi:hypothetical protein